MVGPSLRGTEVSLSLVVATLLSAPPTGAQEPALRPDAAAAPLLTLQIGLKGGVVGSLLGEPDDF